MRALGGWLFAFVLSATSFGAVSAAETWRQHSFEDDGYIVEFPGEPSAHTGTYSSQLVSGAPTSYRYLEDENNLYSATVIEGISPEDSAAILNEADYLLSHFGDTVLNLTSRPGQGYFGRYVTINCRSGVVDQAGGTRITDQAVQNFRDAAGIECVDGASLTAVIVFRKEAGGRLYVITGVNRPDAPIRTRVNAARFAFSLVWAGVNASLVDIVQQYDVSPEVASEIIEITQQRGVLPREAAEMLGVAGE